MPLVWQLLAAGKPIAWILVHLTHDDTFLLLRLAQGWVEHGYPTFDGLHRTNGFQALWGCVTALLALVFPNPERLLRVTLMLAAVLNALTGLGIWRLGRALTPTPQMALWPLACWCAYGLTGRPGLIGLENTLLGVMVVGLLVCWLGLRRSPERWWRWLVFGVVSVVLFWVRLDGVVLLGVVWLGLGWYAVRKGRLGRYCGGALVVLLGGVGLAGFYYWAGGTPTPVSGMVKRLIATQVEPPLTLVGALGMIGDGLLMLLKQAAIGVGALWPRACSSLVRFGLVVLAVVAWRAGVLRLRGWVLVVLVALVAHVLVVRGWLGAYHFDTPWYFAAENVLAAVGVGVLLGRLQGRTRRSAVVALPVLLGLVKVPLAVSLLLQGAPHAGLGPTRLETAAWMRAHIPDEARCAAWNAGELSYFSQRTVVNLDGLVNDLEYYELRVRGGDLDAYLEENGVDWVVDYARDAAGSETHYWGVLPRDGWEVVAEIGDDRRWAQAVIRRVNR